MAPEKIAFVIDSDSRRGGRYRALLEERDFAIRTFMDGNQAIHALRTDGPPDLAVIALSLAGADGFAVIRELRKLATPDQTRLVVTSGILKVRTKAWELRDELGIHAVVPGDAFADRAARAIDSALQGVPTRIQAPAPPALPSELDVSEEADLPRALHGLAGRVAKALDVPIALVSLEIQKSVVIQAHLGASTAPDPVQHPEKWAFCRHLAGGNPLIVTDARHHPVFRGEELVRDGHVRSWIAVPLVGPSGRAFGTIAAVADEARGFSLQHVNELWMLARRVAGDVVLHLRSAGAPAPPASAPTALLAAALEWGSDGLIILDSTRTAVFANRAMHRYLDLPPEVAGTHRDQILARQSKRFVDFDLLEDAFHVADEGPYVHSMLIETRAPRRILRWASRPFPFDGKVFQLVTCRDVTWQTDLLRRAMDPKPDA